MFTAYIKNLNDMVFSTSDSPEEQPSTGVLGRIGSWFSPWRGKGPKSPAEDASPTSDPSLKSDGGDQTEESVKLQAGEQQWEEEKEQSSNPNPLGLTRDIFLCEEQDATQSGHKHSSVVSSTETEQGGPKEEEFVVCRKKRKGQDQEWEESNNSTSVSGNPEKNASHLTHLSSFSKQGVVWDSDQAHTQPQAQTGKRLHVYLEETSVTRCGQNTCAGQEVVRTEVTKSLKVFSKAKSSQDLDFLESSSSACAENKRADDRPAFGEQSCYNTLAGLSLKSQKDSQLKLEPDKEQIPADSMGRKNSGRRRHRKNSQGDGGSSPQEKTPAKAQSTSEGFPSVASPQGKSPKTHMGDSASKTNSTPPASPEGAESMTFSPDTVKQLDNFQDSNSVTSDSLACVVDWRADMEDDDSFYEVERKTETPESKRRSIKVSQSEVKLFKKCVPLNPMQSPAGSNKDFKSQLKNRKDQEKDQPKTETDARVCDIKKNGQEPNKPVAGRIADKISLFERQKAVGVHKQTFQTPRSTDVSPIRKASEKMKADFVLSDQRSRSAEGHGTFRSSSISPLRDKPMSIKERAKKFAEASQTKPVPPLKPAMTGMSHKLPPPPVTVSVSEPTNLYSQGKLDTKELIQTTESEITLKPDGQDTTIAKISIPNEQSTDSKVTDTVASKTSNQGKKSNSVESDVLAKGTDDSSEVTNNISPQPKGPSRTGSRSKRKKNREPTSPVTPNSENKSTSKLEVTALKEQMDDTDETVSVSKQLTEKAPLNKAQRNASDKHNTNTKENTFKESEVLDKPEKQIDSSFKKENIDKPVNIQGELPANKDEPDTAVCNSGTESVDKDTVILPQKEEKSGEHSVVFTEERELVSKESRKTPASSPSPVVERPIQKSLTQEQESPVGHPKLDKELSVEPESKSKGKVRKSSKGDAEQTLQPQSKDTEIINQTNIKDAEKLKKAENQTANQIEKEVKDQPLCSNTNSIKKTESSVVKNNERKSDKTEPIKNVTKPDAKQPESASQSPEKTSGSSHICVQTHSVTEIETTHPEKAAVCAAALTNEAMSVTECDKRSLKGETATNVPPELQSTESPGKETGHVVSAAAPQPNSKSVEKTENSPNDSHTRGAHEISGLKPITKATTAVEEVTVKATNDTAVLITPQTDNMGEKESTTAISVSNTVSTEGAGQSDGEQNSIDKSVPLEAKVLGDILKLAPSHKQCEESKQTVSTSDTASPKGAGNIAQSSSDSSAATSTVNATEKTTEKTFSPPVTELSPAKGDVSQSPELLTVKKKLANNKPNQTPKELTSPEAKKLIPDSTQHLSKKLHLPWGLSKDDSSKRQDAPSSWLDVDFPKKKLKVPEPKLSSSGSESNLLDTSGELDDDNFVEKIKKLCAPFSLPPRKHNHLRPPQPPFALPAIKEDRLEKTFDPEEFKIGLRKKNLFSFDTTPGLLTQLQSTETKSALKPARASLADRSMLLSSLETRSQLRNKTSVKADEDIKEHKDDQIKVKSRLEGSCIFSSLTSSSYKGKRNGLQTQVDGSNSGDVSPSEAHLLSPPPLSQPPQTSPTDTYPIKDVLAKQSPAPIVKEETQAVEAVVCDSGPPLPSFNDIKLPDYLEKYLPREPVKSVQSIQGQKQVIKEDNPKMTTPATGGEEDLTIKPDPLVPKAVLPCLPAFPSTTHSTVPELKQPAAQPQGLLGKNKRTVKSFHKRPGKMVLFEKAQFSGQAYEIYRDVADATSLEFSPVISVRVVRGCWILYEKPDFQGRSLALEEGGIELINVWAEMETDPHNSPPMLIGSIRLAVCDYSIPRIDLFTEPEGHGRVTPYHDDTIETGSFGIPMGTASIQVHSGVWLVFSDPGFQGMIAVLETGVYPFPETWGFPSPFVGSLRPLKMGAFKVENPNEVKAVLYEKPNFEGSCLEIDSDVFSFCEGEETVINGALLDSKKLETVGSLKIIGGLWVGYSEPGFEGQQYILEEGEYLDSSEWGGSEQLLSLRPIQADFVAPHLKMFSDRDFGELGVNIDLTGPVLNMDETGYGMKTQSVEVFGGVWVVFEEPGFCGESYILEKGLYGSPEDWGALLPRVGSAMTVVLDDFENAAKFKVQLFSDPGFQGSVLSLEDSVASLQDDFSVASCKVLAGSWLAFERQDFTGRMYVLEVGSYPDLRSMGFDDASSSIQSLQTAGFVFSLPSITLFERCGLRGKRVVLTDGSVNLQLAGGCSRVQSVLVEGAMWILYERINYRGRQILLKPGEIPDFHQISSWQKIGSLRPLIQKQVHFRLRNRQTGLMMSVTGSLDDVKLMRIQEAEEADGLDQIWFYQNGHLHCKLLEECCLSPSSSVTIAGSRTGLSPEPGMHLWSITPEGFIRYTPTSDLVLEVKGGHHYDKNQVILNSLDPNKLQQRWNVEII